MQIHELTQRSKVQEGLASAFGLDKAVVKQVWSAIGGELVQNIAARYTKDPRYANLPLDQRIRAMQHDEAMDEAGQKYTDNWNRYVNQITVRNGGQPLDDATYRAVLGQWALKNVFGGDMSAITPDMKQKIDKNLDSTLAARVADPNVVASNMRQLAVYAGAMIVDAIKAAGATPGATPAQTAPTAVAKQLQVRVGNEIITKRPDGRWYDQSGDYISDPADIAELERRANRPPASAGAYVR